MAAAAEYILAAILGGTPFWGVPRFYYQLLYAVEAAWLAVLAAFTFGVCGGIYYTLRKRKGELGTASPAFWVVAVAVCGAPAAHFLAVADVSFPWVKSRFAIIAAGLFFVGIVSLWALAAAALYKALTVLGRRVKKVPAKAVLIFLASALLLPVVAADVYYMVAGERAAGRRPDVYVVVMDAFRRTGLVFTAARGARRRGWRRSGGRG